LQYFAVVTYIQVLKNYVHKYHLQAALLYTQTFNTCCSVTANISGFNEVDTCAYVGTWQLSVLEILQVYCLQR